MCDEELESFLAVLQKLGCDDLSQQKLKQRWASPPTALVAGVLGADVTDAQVQAARGPDRCTSHERLSFPLTDHHFTAAAAAAVSTPTTPQLP